MTRRAALSVIALVVAALVGVVLLAVPGSPIHDKANLGLDLQGGLEVTLQAIPPKGRQLTEEDLDRSVEIMRNRVDKLGVSEPEIRKQGDSQIAIQLPGVKDPAAAAAIIGKTAQLEFFDLEANLVAPSVDLRTRQAIPKATVFELLAGQQALAEKGTPDSWYLFDKKKKLVAGPVGSRETALRKHDGKVPDGFRLFGVPEGTVVISCAAGEVCPPGNVVEKRQWYLFKYTPPEVPEMTGAELKLSGTRADFDPQSGQPVVLMEFTGKGRRIFEEITRREAQRGRLLTNQFGSNDNPILGHFAIVLDREIRSWPSIDFREYPGGISGSNGAQITGVDRQEAKDLALVLQTGSLPVVFRTLEQTNISATLGKDSLEEAWKAAIVGLLVVAAFLLLFYRFLGLIAVLGLGIYAALLYAAILLFNVTLTLPGFAGLVLTLGVAADANVVIFERIKEEARAGRSVRAAIGTGYTKGFATIVDANVVTAITAMVLFAVATSSVRGFALMLLVGTVISMLTAVLATRAFLAILADLRVFDNARFVGATGRGIPSWLKFDYCGRRNIFFGFSAIVLALAIGALAVKGLNLGIDFKGGTQVSFQTQQPVALDPVRSQTQKIGEANAVIQGRGSSTNDRYREFQIRTETLTTAETQRLENALTEAVGAQAFGVKNVSASFGKQIRNSAILAIVVSLLLIVVYISLRFQWKFSVPVLVALAHDVVITIGIYALLGREVTTATVAAILTVLGYSIYDTIIIFDRIRENIPLMKRAPFRLIGNVSLWETIPRSLATTFITLLPIASLLILGGDTLKDFAFALLVGIGSGAYSSIGVAGPLLAALKERESEYRSRLDDASALADVKSVGGVLGDTAAAATAP
ncbi:MAG: protein translocase subunit SecD, partial [Actinobacteria bacterium]|nr:protein translocase subunit SecD [Actinomycetota bacterium]